MLEDVKTKVSRIINVKKNIFRRRYEWINEISNLKCSFFSKFLFDIIPKDLCEIFVSIN